MPTAKLPARTIIEGLLIPVGLGLFSAVGLNSYSTIFLGSIGRVGFIGDMRFLLAASIADLLVSFGLLALALRHRIRPWTIPHVVPAVALMIAYVLSATGSIATMTPWVAQVLLGVVWATASFLISTAWLEVLTVESSPVMVAGQLTLSMLITGLVSNGLGALPVSQSAALCITILVVSALLLRNRRRHLRPHEVAENPAPGWFSALLKDTATPLLAFFVFEMVTGMINMFSLTRPSGFSMDNASPMWGMVGASLVFCALIVAKAKMPNPDTLYRVLFPLAIAVLLLLPFFGQQRSEPFGTLIIVGYNLTSLMAVYSYVRVSRDRRASFYVLGSFASGGVRLFLLAGLGLGGLYGRQVEGNNLLLLTLVAVTAVYLLVLAFAYAGHLGKKADQAMATALRLQLEKLASTAEAHSPSAVFDDKARRIAATYRLTPRETDVLLLLGQGRSAGYIGATLDISESTVRGYIKSLYAKLGLHRKQDVVDLFH